MKTIQCCREGRPVELITERQSCAICGKLYDQDGVLLGEAAVLRCVECGRSSSTIFCKSCRCEDALDDAAPLMTLEEAGLKLKDGDTVEIVPFSDIPRNVDLRLAGTKTTHTELVRALAAWRMLKVHNVIIRQAGFGSADRCAYGTRGAEQTGVGQDSQEAMLDLMRLQMRHLKA